MTPRRFYSQGTRISDGSLSLELGDHTRAAMAMTYLNALVEAYEQQAAALALSESLKRDAILRGERMEEHIADLQAKLAKRDAELAEAVERAEQALTARFDSEAQVARLREALRSQAGFLVVLRNALPPGLRLVDRSFVSHAIEDWIRLADICLTTTTKADPK